MKRSPIFQHIQRPRVGRNAFDLSHEKKLSMKMGDLVPFYLEEVVPGDKFRVKSEVIMRMAPMVSPVMHRVNTYTHYFFVPNRLVWDDWESFITGGDDGLSAPVYPTYSMTSSSHVYFKKGMLPDYFGLPIAPDGGVTANPNFSVLPFRGYQTIFNEYYRDENLQNKVTVSKTSGSTPGDEVADLLSMRKRNWEKDYFTSALPWLQKGPSVNAPITLTYDSSPIGTNGVGGNLAPGTNMTVGSDGALITEPSGSAFVVENIDPDSTGIDINDLRKASRLQEWLERNARAGSRYVESMLAHFDVMSDDLRHMRPQFLGGGRTPMTISEVLSTYSGEAANTHDLPQGNMSGHGIGIGASNQFKGRFKEHGYIIGIISTLPRTAYQQGIEKTWLKRDKFDYYWPEFAQLGEQEVINNELYVDWANTPESGEDTFGYQSRYAEYKYKQSMVAGDFRDNLSFWHMGRIFDTAPALNSSFVQSDPTERIFAVDDDGATDKLYVQIYNDVKAIRPMPYWNDPRL